MKLHLKQENTKDNKTCLLLRGGSSVVRSIFGNGRVEICQALK